MEEIIQSKSRLSAWELITKYALYALVFLTPLFFLPWGIYKISFNKQALIITLLLITFFSYLAKSLNEGKIIYKKGGFLLAVFLMLSAISLYFSQSFNISLFGFSGAETDSFINILSFILIYFLLAGAINEKGFKRIIFIYLVSIALLLIYQFLQLFGKFILPIDFTKFIYFTPAADSIYDLIIFFGANFILVLSILFNDAELSKIKRLLLYLLSVFLFSYILLINYSFVWILLAIAVIPILILKLRDRKINITKQNVLIAILTIFIFLYFSNTALIKPLFLQFNIPSLVSLTYSQNLNLIKDSYSNIKNAAIGSGPNTFVYEYLKFRPTNFNQIENLWTLRFNSGHSLILTYFITFGVMASILFLLFALILALKSRNDFFLPVFVYLILTFLFYNSSHILTLMFFAAAGIHGALYSATKEINILAVPQKIFLWSLIIIILMGGSVFALYYQGQRIIASIYYDFSNLEKAVSLDRRSDTYYRSLSQAYLTKGDFNNAVNAGQVAILLNNIDSLNYINLSRIFETLVVAFSAIQNPDDQQKENLYNSYKAAVENYKKASEFDPKNPDISLNVASLHLTMSSFGEAKKAVDDSLVLKPDYANAYFVYSQIFEKEDKINDAIYNAQKAKSYSNDIGILFQLGNLYYKNNQLNQAQIEFENAISLYPNHSNSHYILGLIYDKQGLKDKAIEQFEKILELNPDSEPVKKILENLRAGKSAI